MASSGYNYKPDIIELKQLHAPPSHVKDTMYVLCLLLGYSEREAKDWKFARNLLRSSDLADRLHNHDVKTCSPENVKKAKEVNDNLTPEGIKNVSKAAVSFYQWNSRMISSYST